MVTGHKGWSNLLCRYVYLLLLCGHLTRNDEHHSGGGGVGGEAPSPPSILQAIVHPAHFSGDHQNWDDCHDQFEMAADLNRWDRTTKLKFLTLLVMGWAREAYCGLSDVTRQDYQHLIRALKNALQPGTDPFWDCAVFLNYKRMAMG